MTTATLLSPNNNRNYVQNFDQLEPVIRSVRDQEQIALQQSLDILPAPFDKMYLIHGTNFFPQNGRILARSSIQLQNALGSFLKFEPKNGFYSAILESINKIISIYRSTVHFSINSVVESHESYDDTCNTIVIIDKFVNGLSQLIGGIAEDFFSFGSYNLSKDAVILVPKWRESDKDTQKQIQSLPQGIQVFYHEGDVKTSVYKYLEDQQTHVFSNLTDDCNKENLLHRFGPIHYVSTQEIMKKARKTSCSHSLTPNLAIEYYLLQMGLHKVYDDCRIQKKLTEYTICIKEVFPLNSNQQSLLKLFLKTLMISTEVLQSPSSELFLDKFAINEELISYYDEEIDLEQEIPNQTATKNLSQLTMLPFKAYLRRGCQTIVDAACLVQDPFQIEKLLSDLNQRFKMDFFSETHNGNHYLVLKGVNIPEVVNQIV